MRWNARRTFLAGAAIVLLAMSAPAHAREVELCRFDGDVLAEISGLAHSTLHEGVVWAHNDSGGGPKLYALDTSTCEIRAVLKVQGVAARDPEALAVGIGSSGTAALWWGDIGDNTAQRDYLEIHEIPEPSILRSGDVVPTTYRVRLGERGDAEALLADGSQLWIMGKGLLGGTVWKLPRLQADTTVRARAVGSEGPLVTDAAMRPGGGYAVRDYSEVRIYSGRPPGELITRMPLPAQVQGEAMTWTPDGRSLIIASEGDDRLLLVPVDAPLEGVPQGSLAGSRGESVAADADPLPEASTSASPQQASTDPGSSTPADVTTSPTPTALESVDRVGSLAVIALVLGLGVFIASAAAVPLLVRLRARR